MSAYGTGLMESPKEAVVAEAIRQHDRAEAAEAALAAAREESKHYRALLLSVEERLISIDPQFGCFSGFASLLGALLREYAALRARASAPERVERVVLELKRLFPVGTTEVVWWEARARAVLAAADGEEVKP